MGGLESGLVLCIDFGHFTAVQQMHYEVARMFVVSSKAEDSRAKELALSLKLKQQLNVFHDRFDGFFLSETQDATLELRKL